MTVPIKPRSRLGALPFRKWNFFRKLATTKESQRYSRSPLNATPEQLMFREWGLELT